MSGDYFRVGDVYTNGEMSVTIVDIVVFDGLAPSTMVYWRRENGAKASNMALDLFAQFRKYGMVKQEAAGEK
jgi:hypothetical protein